MGSPGAAWRALGSPTGTLFKRFGDIFASLVAPWRSLLAETLIFVILSPLCSKTTTFEGPPATVGATWPPKLYLGSPIGILSARFGDILAPLVAPWTALWAQNLTPGQQSHYFREASEPKSLTFENLDLPVGATWAQKSRSGDQNVTSVVPTLPKSFATSSNPTVNRTRLSGKYCLTIIAN